MGIRDRCFREQTWGVFVGRSQEPPTGADKNPSMAPHQCRRVQGQG